MANLFDCQYDSTNYTNSFVVGRASTSSDYGKFVSAQNLGFEGDVFFELEAADYELGNVIDNFERINLYADNNGISLEV